MSTASCLHKRARWVNLVLGKLRQFNMKRPLAFMSPRVELFYWKPDDGRVNFGDHLSSVIVRKILMDRGLSLEQTVSEPARLLAIGSILHFAHDNRTIWGSGVNGKIQPSLDSFKRLDVRAVRGPKTCDFLMERGISVPEIYGDPALLLSRLMPHWRGRLQTRKFAFVPNLHDLVLTRGWANVVSPFDPWERCVDNIVSSEFVMASSLHGLIVAESYDIPARYVRLSDTEDLFKYEDYVLGTGRTELEFAHNIEEALEMGGMPPPKFDAEKLLAAFPFDLWEKKMPAR